MNKTLKALLIVPIALGLSVPATSGKLGGKELNQRQQKKYDARLAGRTAGKPISCINRWDRKYMSVISDDVILFGKSRTAKTIYVNKPYGGCSGAEDHALVTRSGFSQLCKGEIAQVQDLVNGSFQGSCAWGEFVPYTKDPG